MPQVGVYFKQKAPSRKGSLKKMSAFTGFEINDFFDLVDGFEDITGHLRGLDRNLFFCNILAV